MTAVSIILVDKRIQDYETIVTALKQDVVKSIVFDVLAIDTAICQDTSTTSFQYILNKIAEIGVDTITNVGIVQHNTGAPFHRFFSQLQGEESVIASVETVDPTLQSWAEFAGFITTLKNTYNVQNVDLMACALYSNPNWKYVIDTLAKQTGVALRASTDDTGAEALGGDWFLESHTGVNLKDVYFTEAIENYQGVLLYIYKFGSQFHITKSFTPGTAIAWGFNDFGGDTTLNIIGGSLSSNIIAVYSNSYAFAALRTNGSVVTWGSNSSGAAQSVWDGSALSNVANSLTTGVTKIYTTQTAMAALKNDGTVITWGSTGAGGNSSTVTLTNVVDIYPAQYVFAALKSDGSVKTWGGTGYGSDSSAVASSINSNVVSVNMGTRAGAALKKDGSVITWGDTTYGGNSSSVSSSLSSGVVVIYTNNEYSYVALKNNNSVVTWGYQNASVPSSSLLDVVSIFAHRSMLAYAALKLNGSIVVWGTTNVSSTEKFVKVCSSSYNVFAALTSTGNVITWGASSRGGDSSAVAASISDSNVVDIYSTYFAFAALKKNGQLITWGTDDKGGNSTAVMNDISANVVAVYSTEYAFAALRKDGKVIVWGDTLSGGAPYVYVSSSNTTKPIDGGNLDSGITFINNSSFAFAAIQNTVATSFDLSASYYTDNDRYDILRNKENRRRVNLTTLNNNVFTLSSARDIERFNYTIPSGTGPFRIIIPDYVDSNYSITSTASIPGVHSTNYIIACDECEPVTISGVTYINYGAFVYVRNADYTFTKVITTTIGTTKYHLYGGDGIYSSGIALLYLIGPFTIPTKMYGDESFNLTDPSSNSPAEFTYTSSNEQVATISGRTVTVIGIGTTTITATQAADVNYASSSIAALFTVEPITTVIGEFTVSAKTYGTDTSFNLVDPSSNNPAEFTYTSSNEQVATISGRTVTIVGPGTSIITASQASGIYSSADVSGSLIVNFGNTNTISRVLTSGAYVIPKPLSNIETTYGSLWNKLGADIYGEAQDDQSGYSVSISADGTVVAIGAPYNDGTGYNYGHVRVYKYTPNKTIAVTNQNDLSFGPIGWTRIGADIDRGVGYGGQFGYSISLSADGTVIAISAYTGSPNSSTGPFGLTSIFSWNGTAWVKRGGDIYGENDRDYSGISVSLSADGTVVAIGAFYNDGETGITDDDRGHVRVYKYNPNKTTAITDQSLSNFGPVGWDRLGKDIDGESFGDNSGRSVSLSADGTVVAIGADYNDGATGNNNDNRGHVRVYKYNPNKTTAITDQSLSNFGPVGWDRLGKDIDGEYVDINSGRCVSISADGTTVAIGAIFNDGSGNLFSNCGHVRIYRYNPNKTLDVSNETLSTFGPAGWDRLGGDIDGDANGGYFGNSISLSSDGNIVAIGAQNKSPGGQVRIYKYRANKTTPQLTNQNAADFGPVGWDQIGGDINAVATADGNGWSVSLSSDGTTLAIGARANDGQSGTEYTVGSVRVFRIDTSGNYTYTSNNSNIAEVFGNIILLKNLGSTTIAVTQSASGGSSSRSGTIPLIISGITPTFGTFTIPAKNFGDASFNLTAPTSESSGAFTYASSNSAVATVTSEGTVTIVSAGTTTITATQAASADGIYATRDISGSLVVSPIAPTFGTFTIPAKNFGDASFNLTAPTSDSSGVFTYVSSDNAVATVTSGGTVTIVGFGTTTITATQAASADGNYIARDISGSLVVSISLSNFTVPAKIYGDASFNLIDPDSGDNTVGFTFTSSNNNVATLDGRIVTIVGVGSTVITATQEATASRGQLDISATLVVSPRTPIITLDPIVKLYGNSSFRPQPSTTNTDISGGRVFTFTSDNIAVVSMLDASLVRINGVGTTTLRYTQAASANFTDASGTVSITVNKGASGFSASTFAVATNKTYGDPSFAITTVPISSSTGAITYSSSNEAVATINNSGIITLVGQGTVTFTASQVETALYEADSNTSNTLTVTRKTVALSRNTPSAATITKYYGDASFSIIATNESNGEISYTSSDPSFATIDPSSGRVNIIAVGTTTLTARRAQTAQYNETDISWSLTINRSQTTLTGLSSITRNVTDAPFSITATSASDGAVTYALQDPLSTVLTIHPTSGLVTLLSPGSATIVASQAQGTLYEAPPNITATITVTAASNILEGTTLTNTNNFENVDLSGASLANTTITNTNFTSGRLNNAVFNGSNISNANMTLTELSNASLTNTTITNTTFVSGRLNNANLNGTTITGSNMTSTDLSGANIKGATINGTNFTSAILARTDLSGSTIRSSIFNNANLSGSTLTRIDASGSSFVNANLSNTNLSNADFTNANMTNANISDANLTNVSFTVTQKLQLLKNTNNRVRSEIQVSEVFGNVLLSVLSEGSSVRDVPNVSNAQFKVMVPTTSFNPNDTIPNIVLDISNYGYFYLPIGEYEYFQIENIRYFIVGSTIRNYLTGTVVENIIYGVKAIRLITGSLTIVVNSINTLSSSSFIVPSYKLNTDISFSPTTLPTSNSSAPIVYTSSNTGIATIDSSSGIITPVAGACGFVTFTASQVATETHEAASIISNELFVNRLINLSLPGLNQTINLSEYASLDTASITPENTDATAVMYVRVSDMRELFQYQTDSNDINDISASDIKYYVFHRKFPTEIKINPSHAMMNKTESYGMYGNIQEFNQDKSLVKHDFIRYIALRLFNTFYGVDLFKNETELHENIAYLGDTVQHNINLILTEISTTSSSETMAIDASGNKYLTNDASGNTNLCRELMRQIAATNPSRLYDNDQNYSGIRPVPLLENDSINFKVSITPASGQNTLTGVSVIPARTYLIKLVLKNTVNTVTNTNTKVTDSEMYPNSYLYSSSVVTYAPTLDSSNVFHAYSPPAPIPFSRFGYNGWYYANTTEWVNVAPLVRDRIKWTISANTGSSTVSDLKYIRLNLKIFNKTSLPFIVVYTSSNSYRKYTITTPNAIVNGTVYSFYMNFNAYSREPAIIGATNAELTYSGVSSGSFASNEVISSITIETDNTAVASSIEFTLSSIIIGDTSGEKEHGFSASVIDTYP